jgi:hypothetical protein
MKEAPVAGTAGRATVAVVIPAYNADPYLDQALASVAGQTRRPDEVVVVDDCSTDDTAERARRWQGHLPLQVVRLPVNKGCGPARHEAVLATTARLVATLDADDVLLPDHLEMMISVHERTPGIVTSTNLLWIPGRSIDLSRPTVPQQRVPDPPGQLLGLLRENYLASASLYARELYDRTTGYGEPRYAEDWPIWLQMVRAGATVTRLPYPTVLRRIHAASLSFEEERMIGASIQVLTEAGREARTKPERQAVRGGLRRLQARRRYYRARILATGGQPWQARLEALRGRPGTVPMAARLTAIAAAPRTAIRIERAVKRHRASSAG